MAQEPQAEDPILFFKKATLHAVQQVLDRAQRAAARANSKQQPTNLPEGNRLALVLEQAMAAHGRTATARISIRRTATDTGGRPFHFAVSHITKGKRAKRGEAGKNGGVYGKEGSQSAEGKPLRAPGAGRYKAKTQEGAHQAYTERGGAVERDHVPLETLNRSLDDLGRGIEDCDKRSARGHQADRVEHVTTRQTDRGDGMDGVENIGVDREVSSSRETRTNAGQHEPDGQTEKAGPNAGRTGTARAETYKLSAKDWVEEGMRDRPGLSAASSGAAAQAYLEDPSKVATASGTTSSFGTIGDTIEERMAFWDLVNEHESSAGGRTQSRLVLELPHESTPRARYEIVRRYVQEEFEDRGIPYWATIHQPTTRNDFRNYHAHVVFTGRPMRMMDHPETGETVWDFTVEEAFKDATRHTRVRYPHCQNRDPAMRERTWVKNSRRRFSDIVNDVMVKNGLGLRYDPRSYEDMGLGVPPMKNVDRILNDKLKTQPFLVMDAEWTRRMIDAEMREAALRRDETYLQLQDIESRIQDAARQKDRAKKANERLPRGMAIAPGRRVTPWLAERVGGGLLEVERARLSAQFVDEATERMLTHVIEATGPNKTARGEAKLASGAPDQDSLCELHQAAQEELAAFSIEKSERVKGYRQAGNAFREAWKRGTQAHSPTPKNTIEESGPHARIRSNGTATAGGVARATPLRREAGTSPSTEADQATPRTWTQGSVEIRLRATGDETSGPGPSTGYINEGMRARRASRIPSRSEIDLSMRAAMTAITGTNQQPDSAAFVAAARAFGADMVKTSREAKATSTAVSAAAPAVVAFPAVKSDTVHPTAEKTVISPRSLSASAAAPVPKEAGGKVSTTAQQHDQRVTSGSAVDPADTIQEQLSGDGDFGLAGPSRTKKGAETAVMPHTAGPSTAAPYNAGSEPVAKGEAEAEAEEEREAKRKRRKAILAAKARGRGM